MDITRAPLARQIWPCLLALSPIPLLVTYVPAVVLLPEMMYGR